MKFDELILASLTDQAISLLDANGVVLSWSVGAEKMTGFVASEVVGKNFSIFYSGEELQNEKPMRDLRTAAVQGRFAEEASRFRKNGAEFWASVTILTVRDEKENLPAFVNVVRDISRRRDDALALLQARAMLENRVEEKTQDLLRSNIELEQFAYLASHDLQTPLRHISSYVQLLTNKIRKSPVLDEKAEKWIEYIISGTKQMKNLISDLLAYSRIGRVDIRVEEIETMNLLARIVDELREPIRVTHAKIIFDELPSIFGIRSQFEQLFQNFIENALKFKKTDVDPVIVISCQDQGEFWRFSVSDNGIGINPKYSERIFLMFQRLHSADEFEGTGIGLAICKKIIEFHGGKIWLNAAINTGAVFSFELPKKERVTTAKVTGVPREESQAL